MEDLRHGFQKRIKQLEVQVEEEADERTRANNQRKEAEQKLQVKFFNENLWIFTFNFWAENFLGITNNYSGS